LPPVYQDHDPEEKTNNTLYKQTQELIDPDK